MTDTEILREWFAGMALAGLVTSRTLHTAEHTAGLAYRYADAMIAAREAGGENPETGRGGPSHNREV